MEHQAVLHRRRRGSVRSACRSGVRRLVLLSGRGEAAAQLCERIVRDSGAEWTILRASWFCRNFSEHFLVESLLTVGEVVGEIARAAGREIRYVQNPPDEFTSGLRTQDEPADLVALLRYPFTTVLDGRNAHLADGVRRVLGGKPRDFTDYGHDAAATGVWDAPGPAPNRDRG